MRDPVKSSNYCIAATLLFQILLMHAPGAAPAQATEPQQATEQPATPENEEPMTLGEVIVTARKRDERLVDVPSSIVALSERTIENAHVDRIDDLAGLVPNLNINSRADSSPNVTLRGVGAFGVVQGVGFYVNDVQQFEGQLLPIDDVEQIQVLRGPQGTLYGGSNIGGAIKYTTKRPSQELTGQLKVEGGRWGTQNLSAVLSGPVAGALGARLSVFDNGTDGFLFNTTINETIGDKHETGGRLTFEYDGDATRALLYLTATRERNGTFIPFYEATDDDTYLTTVSYNDDPPIFLDRDVSSAVLQIDHDFDRLTLTSLSSFFHSKRNLRADLDFSATPLFYVDVEQRHDIYAQELRLASPSGEAFSWLVGVFLQYRTDPDTSLFHIVPAGLALPTKQISHGYLYAAFANAIYKRGPWTVEAGVRAEYDDNRLRVTHFMGTAPEESEITRALLPRASVSYALREGTNAYAAVTRGFTPGNLTFVNFPAVSIENYSRETTINYEVGIKGSSLEERVHFEADVFYVPYSHRLFQSPRVFPGVGFVQVTDNVGDSKNYGVELSADARVTEEFTVSAAVGVTKAEWDEAIVQDPNTNAPLNLDGLDAPYVPEYQGTLSLDWAHPLRQGLTLGLRADASFIGEAFWNLSNSRRQRAYQLANFSARLESRNWQLSAHLYNAFDEAFNTEYYTAAEVGAASDIAAIGQPRTWTAALTFKF